MVKHVCLIMIVKEEAVPVEVMEDEKWEREK